MTSPVISLADVKLSASTSFTEREVHYLDQLLAILRRGGTVSTVLLRRPEVQSISRKLPTMLAAIERNKARREGR